MTEIEEALSELRQTFNSGRTRSVAWRKAQLKALLQLVKDKENKVLEALYQDLGKHPVEAYRDEVGVVVKTIDYILRNLDKWVTPTKAKLPLPLFPTKGELLPEPLGVVLIFASWNFPISLALDPVIGAIAAGNTVVLKPSEQAPACSSLIAKTIPEYMDPTAIRVIEGRAQTSDELLKHKWDKIFFTGNPQVGRIVMTAAAKHLTPVTLELGGKCPVVLDSLSSPSDLKVAIKRIVSGKWGPCSGQACIGIDYMLVEEKIAPTVLSLFSCSNAGVYCLSDVKVQRTESAWPELSISIIFRDCRISSRTLLLKLPLYMVVHWMKKICKFFMLFSRTLCFHFTVIHLFFQLCRFIEPIILLDPPLDAAIMNEEIFGPLLPIITLKNIQESIGFINTRPKPLTIYAFTKDENFKKKILSETSSGTVVFNDVLIQFLCDGLPFGGVGSSGFGRYHGKFSFDTFSHEKAVMRGSFFPEFEPRYPPWNSFKFKFIRLAYDLDYIGLLMLIVGLKSHES